MSWQQNLLTYLPNVLKAAKNSCLAPLVIKLLSGMGTCKKFPLFGEQEEQDQKFEDITQADVTRVSRNSCGSKCSKLANDNGKRGGGVSIIGQKLKNTGLGEKGEEGVCSDCKVAKSKCCSGETVRCVEPGQVRLDNRISVLKPCLQIGCRVVTDGPYWNLKNQGMVATVVKAADSGSVTVRCDIACQQLNFCHFVSGGTRTGGVWEGRRGKLAH